jgi:uncharacterized protein YbjT (DUF2867 family)
VPCRPGFCNRSALLNAEHILNASVERSRDQERKLEGGLFAAIVMSTNSHLEICLETEMSNRTAIVLGASGSVGQALLAEILQCGSVHRVLVMTRRPLPLPAGSPVEERLVPAMTPEGLTQAVVEALHALDGEVLGFSVLGVGAGTAKLTLEEHRAVDVALNAAFAQGLKASGKVQHLLFMSAIGADHNARTTGSGAAGMARYARVKGEAEVAVTRQGPAIVSLFRPSLILGSQHTPRLLAALLPLFTWLTPVNFRSIRTTEIASAMVAAALHRPAQSAIYNFPQMMDLCSRK